MSSFEFHTLDKSFDRNNFDCGSLELNNFLKTKARQNQSLGFNKTFVAIARGEKNKIILGYYSLSMGEVELTSLPEALIKKLSRHPVPVARMGRLAVDAKDDSAKNFYLKYGFTPLIDEPMTLFLPLVNFPK